MTRGATRVPCWGWDPAGMLFVDSIPVSLISKLSVPSCEMRDENEGRHCQWSGVEEESSPAHSTHLLTVPVEQVLIVDNRGDEAENKLSAPPGLRVPGPVLHVLPKNSVVLLVHADRFLHRVRVALAVGQRCVKVVDVACEKESEVRSENNSEEEETYPGSRIPSLRSSRSTRARSRPRRRRTSSETDALRRRMGPPSPQAMPSTPRALRRT